MALPSGPGLLGAWAVAVRIASRNPSNATSGTLPSKLLVENGLTRIYGTRTPLPDGRDSRTYLARLAELEARAKREHKGAWRFSK